MHYRSSATVTRSGVIPLSTPHPSNPKPLPTLNQADSSSNARLSSKQHRSLLDVHLSDLRNKERTFFSISYEELPEIPIDFTPTPSNSGNYLMQPNFVNEKPNDNYAQSQMAYNVNPPSHSNQEISNIFSPNANSSHFRPITPEEDFHNFSFTPSSNKDALFTDYNQIVHLNSTEFSPMKSLAQFPISLPDEHNTTPDERKLPPLILDSPTSSQLEVYFNET